MGLIDEKNRGSKISCYCPFKHHAAEPRIKLLESKILLA
jgi:hypothetical protein